MSIFLPSMFGRCGVSPCIMLNDTHRQHILYIAPSELRRIEDTFIRSILNLLPENESYQNAFIVKKIQKYAFIGFCTKSRIPEKFASRTGHITAWGLVKRNKTLISNLEIMYLIRCICVLLSVPIRINGSISVVEEIEKHRKFPNSKLYLDDALADLFRSLDECFGYRHSSKTLDRNLSSVIRYFNRLRSNIAISTNRSAFFQEMSDIAGANVAAPLIAWHEMNYPSDFLVLMPDFGKTKTVVDSHFVFSRRNKYQIIQKI